MKFLFSIFFLVIFQCSYSQATNRHYTRNVGEIEKCIINKKGKNKCGWIARLGYKRVGSKRWYELKYKIYSSETGSKPKKEVREIGFFKNSQEVDYVYRQIERWKSDTDKEKPENIKIDLGYYILEVSEARSGADHELYFAFEDTRAKSAENLSANGISFKAQDLKKLFGITE